MLRTECLEGVNSPPPTTRINTWGDCLFTWKLKLTVDPLNSDPLNSDCWSPPRINTWGDHLFTWKLKLTVDPLNSDHLNSNHRSPQDQHMRWLPFHVKVKVDCWSSQQQSLIPPGSTKEAIASTVSIVDLPRVDTVDRPPYISNL